MDPPTSPPLEAVTPVLMRSPWSAPAGGGGARRKRLEGSKSLKGGNALPSIEDLEKEFEAVSFGDLFFGRALEEELSMSYSFSYG